MSFRGGLFYWPIRPFSRPINPVFFWEGGRGAGGPHARVNSSPYRSRGGSNASNGSSRGPFSSQTAKLDSESPYSATPA